MEKDLSLFQKSMPSIVRNVAQWFEVDVTIKLFGVKVFSFTWPPKESQNPQN